MKKPMTYAQKLDAQIKLGAKYFAPPAPQRLGPVTPSGTRRDGTRSYGAARMRSSPSTCARLARSACGAEFPIHELLAHLDKVAVEASRLTLTHPHNASGFTLTTALPANPTFRQLAHAADKLIEESDDLHRLYRGLLLHPATVEIELSTGS